MKIDHVQLAMPAGAEEQARAFFGGILGMEEELKPEPLRSRGGCWFRSGSCVVHVGVEGDFRPQRKAHPAFLVEDIEDLAARFAAAGIAITRDDALPDLNRFYAADPFGNRLEFLQDGTGFSQTASADEP
jgi:catechol 2,3-dioxygenase-like lactoylglutathione lyase family enzyme